MREDAIFTALQWQEAMAAGSIDWMLFTEWLEADPANRAAYGAVTRLDAMIDSHGIAPGLTPQAGAGVQASRIGEPCASHQSLRPAGGASRYSAAKPM